MDSVADIVDPSGRRVWALYWPGGRILMPKRGTTALVVASSSTAAATAATKVLKWGPPERVLPAGEAAARLVLSRRFPWLLRRVPVVWDE